MSDNVLENDVKARLLSVAHDLQTRRAGSSRDFLFKDHIAIGGGRENQLEVKSLLYGSNRSAGDFQIWGHATRNCNGTVSFDVRYEWNDIIDPNYKHGIDRWLAPIFLNAGAKNYATRDAAIRAADSTAAGPSDRFSSGRDAHSALYGPAGLATGVAHSGLLLLLLRGETFARRRESGTCRGDGDGEPQGRLRETRRIAAVWDERQHDGRRGVRL